MKKISVIIPAYNDAARLERTLLRLREIKAREYPELQVIASVRPSHDGTEAVARELADLVVPGGMPSAGRNSGARAAAGDILIFLDADTLPGHGVMKAIAAACGPRVIGSCTAYSEERSPLAALTTLSINFLRWSGLIKGLSNLLFCDAGLFRAHGIGYDERLSVGEHHDFIRRARARGYAFRYVRTSPGYAIDMERHRNWGYFPLMCFWFKWTLLHGVLRRPAKHLEAEYWNNCRRAAAPSAEPVYIAPAD